MDFISSLIKGLIHTISESLLSESMLTLWATNMWSLRRMQLFLLDTHSTMKISTKIVELTKWCAIVNLTKWLRLQWNGQGNALRQVTECNYHRIFNDYIFTVLWQTIFALFPASVPVWVFVLGQPNQLKGIAQKQGNSWNSRWQCYRRC